MADFIDVSKIDLGLAGVIREARNEIRGASLDFVRGNSLFKVRVGKQNRITIPDPEAEAMEIREGDLVQVMVIPLRYSINRKKKGKEDI
ncbi:MAG: hypothetical protein MASP_00314 [Candidatus Methanolliviera sp. GoM_asphalt]|nr:MAG: hypothetical protein MASP_00314 [Candidatus Methanolliviera sp. GoM_asphalt]